MIVRVVLCSWSARVRLLLEEKVEIWGGGVLSIWAIMRPASELARQKKISTLLGYRSNEGTYVLRRSFSSAPSALLDQLDLAGRAKVREAACTPCTRRLFLRTVVSSHCMRNVRLHFAPKTAYMRVPLLLIFVGIIQTRGEDIPCALPARLKQGVQRR